MNRIARIAALSTISTVLFTGLGFAQDHDDRDRRDNHSYQDRRDGYQDRRDGYQDRRDYDRHDWNDRDHDHYIRHDDWRRGRRLPPDYWEHARRVDDWRAYHLRRPPRGYEWREVDGNYVMAAVATGIIASVIAANAAH